MMVVDVLSGNNENVKKLAIKNVMVVGNSLFFINTADINRLMEG